GSSRTPSARPDSPNRSGRPGCPVRSRACGPAPSAAARVLPDSGRRYGSRAPWGSVVSGLARVLCRPAAWRADPVQLIRWSRMSVEGNPGRGVGREFSLGVCAWSGLMIAVGDEGDQLAGDVPLAGLAKAGLVLLSVYDCD